MNANEFRCPLCSDRPYIARKVLHIVMNHWDHPKGEWVCPCGFTGTDLDLLHHWITAPTEHLDFVLALETMKNGD